PDHAAGGHSPRAGRAHRRRRRAVDALRDGALHGRHAGAAAQSLKIASRGCGRGTIRAMRGGAVAILGIVMVIVAACETVPYTGRSQLILLPESTELQMGLQSYQ